MPLRFSIIIPTRNRATLLDQSLGAIGALDYSRAAFEVMVVDDGSNQPPDEIVARHSGFIPLHVFRTEGVGPASARNLALRHARGEYVVFTDDDCRPQPQWLRALDQAISQYPLAGFGGRIVDSPENGIFGRTSQMLVSFLYDYAERSKGLHFFCSNNLIFPRRELLKLGGFDESFPLAAAEDRYICARWLTQGSLRFVPEAVVEHRQVLHLRSFLRQHFRYGRGAYQYWLRRQAESGVENSFESWHFYGEMLTFPLRRVALPQAVVMSGLIVISQIACALGYFVEKYQTRPERHRA